MSKELLKKVTKDMIPKKYIPLVEAMGFEGFISTVKKYGGECIYVPKHENITREIRNENIKKEFESKDFKDKFEKNRFKRELAKKYHLCYSSINSIVENKYSGGK